VFDLFFCVTLASNCPGGEEIVSGRLHKTDMISATRTLEKTHPSAIRIYIRKLAENELSVSRV
jgi:hypothetical protein